MTTLPHRVRETLFAAVTFASLLAGATRGEPTPENIVESVVSGAITEEGAHSLLTLPDDAETVRALVHGVETDSGMQASGRTRRLAIMVLTHTRDQDGNIRIEVPEQVALLKDILAGPQSGVELVIEVAHRMPPSEKASVVDAVCRLLESDDPNIVIASIGSLRRMGGLTPAGEETLKAIAFHLNEQRGALAASLQGAASWMPEGDIPPVARARLNLCRGAAGTLFAATSRFDLAVEALQVAQGDSKLAGVLGLIESLTSPDASFYLSSDHAQQQAIEIIVQSLLEERGDVIAQFGFVTAMATIFRSEMVAPATRTMLAAELGAILSQTEHSAIHESVQRALVIRPPE